MTPASGRAAALAGIAIFGAGVLVATGAGFVILLRLKRPEPDPLTRAARRALLAGGALGAAGLALFAWAAARG